MSDPERKPIRRKASHKKTPTVVHPDASHTPSPAAGDRPATMSFSGDAVLDTDLHGAITAWNRGAEQLFGYSAREAVGQSVHLVVPVARFAEQDELAARAEHGETI